MGTTVFGDEPAPRGSTQGRRGSNVNSLVQQAAEQAHRNAGLKGTPTLSRSTSRKQISRQASRGEAKQGQANSHDESHAKAGEQGHGHGNSHGHGHGHSHGHGNLTKLLSSGAQRHTRGGKRKSSVITGLGSTNVIQAIEQSVISEVRPRVRRVLLA